MLGEAFYCKNTVSCLLGYICMYIYKNIYIHTVGNMNWPSSLQRKPVPCAGAFPFLRQDFAFVLAEFHQVPVCPSSRPAGSLWLAAPAGGVSTDPPVWCRGELAGSALHHLLLVAARGVKEGRSRMGSGATRLSLASRQSMTQ